MTKYKFNEEAADFGLSIKIGNGCTVKSTKHHEMDLYYVETEVCSFLARRSDLYHDANYIQYAPNKHPITLKITHGWGKDAQIVMPYKINERCVHFIKQDGEKEMTSAANLFVQFDLEVIEE